jgi:hypothetical protein
VSRHLTAPAKPRARLAPRPLAPRVGAAARSTEARVVGMSRSGNHAIINWILAQWPGRTCWLNCAEAGTNPFATARPLHGDDRVHRATFLVDLAAERSGKHAPKDLLLHSYEDTFLKPLASTDERREALTGPAQRRLDILILRDPYNLFASRMAGHMGWVSPRVAVRIWSQHAREFCAPRHLRHDLIAVSYNDWATSREYRRSISDQLGVEFDDTSSRRVPATGGGSSFDGTAHDGAAHRMAVLERWQHYAGDPAYRATLTGAVHELAERIFGPLPAGHALRESEGAPVAGGEDAVAGTRSP